MQHLLEQLHTLEARWSRILGTPLWYVSVAPEIKTYLTQIEAKPEVIRDQCKSALYDFFEEHLRTSTIFLGKGLAGADAERKRIDTVVIHHTSQPPGLRPIRLSAIELIRLYVPYFANPTDPRDIDWRGQPIASGHERSGFQVFWPYHWIIRGDGTAERLLYDSEIGWHAGDWDVNRRSVGIVFDDDLESREPPEIQLRSAADLIAKRYRSVPASRIFGHREITTKTECPSRRFLAGKWGDGWKSKLLEHVKDATRLAA